MSSINTHRTKRRKLNHIKMTPIDILPKDLQNIIFDYEHQLKTSDILEEFGNIIMNYQCPWCNNHSCNDCNNQSVSNIFLEFDLYNELV